VSSLSSNFGLTLDDLKAVAGGEVAAAVIELPPDQWGWALLVDTSGHLDEAEALLETVSQRLVGAGAAQKRSIVAGAPVLTFHLPPQGGLDGDRKRLYFLQGDLLGLANDVRVVRDILSRAAGQGTDSLAEMQSFQTVMGRCGKDAGQSVPQVRWFVEPLGALRAVEAFVAKRRQAHGRHTGKSLADVLQKTGYLAIEAVGGYVEIGGRSCDLLHRTFVLARPPFDNNREPLAPQAWVPQDVTTYLTFYSDIGYVFDSVGPVFDEVFGEGETGAWEDVLDGLKNDRNGPQIDLRTELIDHLSDRVTALVDHQSPVSPTCEQFLLAIETTNPAAVAKGLEKLFRDDSNMRRRRAGECLVWEAVPKEAAPVPTISLEMPALMPDLSDVRESPVADQAESLMGNVAITVAHGNLMVASHRDFLDRILTQPQRPGTLAESPEFAVVDATLKDLGVGTSCACVFSRPAEELRVSYELWRQSKMPENETMLGRLFCRLVSNRGSMYPRQADALELAEYAHLIGRLGPAGHFGVCEENGWFFKGFILRNDAVQTARLGDENEGPVELR
jgi:hypothetical protein